MLYIDEDQNITLTRGDTGIFNISLQSQDGQTYVPQTGLSVARSSLAAASVGNYALFGGGQISGSESSTVDVYTI